IEQKGALAAGHAESEHVAVSALAARDEAIGIAPEADGVAEQGEAAGHARRAARARVQGVGHRQPSDGRQWAGMAIALRVFTSNPAITTLMVHTGFSFTVMRCSRVMLFSPIATQRVEMRKGSPKRPSRWKSSSRRTSTNQGM